MSKDVILDKYARLYEIPNQLSRIGHDVDCYCLSYQSHANGIWNESDEVKKLKWHSKSYIGLNKAFILSYPFYLLELLSKNKPDIIIAASDIPHIIMGGWLAKKLAIPFVADLYDNFEAYGQAKIPFMKFLFHRALSSAKLVSTTSYSLAEKIRKQYPGVLNVYPMPSVIDKKIFKSGDKTLARKNLSLPLNQPLIGTAGGLTKMKGIADLFGAWEILKKKNDQACLILAGPTEDSTKLPGDDRVIYLGLLPHHDVVTLFQALDVGVLCIPDDEFGQYCFPQKAYEMLACKLKIVSSAIGDMKFLLDQKPKQLYCTGDAQDLADKIIFQLESTQQQDLPILDWQDTLMGFDGYLKQLI